MKQKSVFAFLYLLFLQIGRASLQVFLFQKGFVSVSADEFTRAIRALSWSNHFTFNFSKDFTDVWLPFEKYINGFAFSIYPEAIITPRVTVFFFSCLATVGLFFLLKISFDSYPIAILGTLLISFQPWFVWLSGTPMLEMYYFPFLFSGIALVVCWLKYEKNKYAYLAGLCFLITSGFHIQSWIFINIVNLIILIVLLTKIRNISKKVLLPYFGLFVISNLLIGLIWLNGLVQTGEILAPFRYHVGYSTWYYGYDQVPWIEKFLYYPRLVWNALPVSLWISVVAGIIIELKNRKRWNFIPLVIGISTLLFNSIINIFSVPASAAPERFSLFYTTLFLPYSIAGIVDLAKTTENLKGKKHVRVFGSMLLILPLIIGVWQNTSKIFQFPVGMAEDTIRTGYFLKRMINTTSPQGKILLELKYWDFQAIKALTGREDLILYDRKLDVYNRQLPSVLTDPSISICNYLQSKDIKWLVIQNETLKTIAGQQFCLSLRKDIGRWKVFEVK